MVFKESIPNDDPYLKIPRHIEPLIPSLPNKSDGKQHVLKHSRR